MAQQIPPDKFGVVGDVAQEPAAILRLARRGWPTTAIAKVLNTTTDVVARDLLRAKEDERRNF